MYSALQWNPLINIYTSRHSWETHSLQLSRLTGRSHFRVTIKHIYLGTFLKCPITGVRLEVRG